MNNYTYDEYLETVYGALRTLTDDEKDSVLSNLKPHEIFAFLTTDEKEKVNEYVKNFENTLLANLRYYNALCKLLGIELPKEKTIVESYRELNTDNKFDTALALMNEPDFQRDCSKILIDDYRRLAKSDPVIGALDKLLNMSGYFEKALAQGIGCDHKYEAQK